MNMAKEFKRGNQNDSPTVTAAMDHTNQVHQQLFSNILSMILHGIVTRK